MPHTFIEGEKSSALDTQKKEKGITVEGEVDDTFRNQELLEPPGAGRVKIFSVSL